MRTLFAAVTALFLVVGLAACGDNDHRYTLTVDAAQVDLDVGDHVTVNAAIEGSSDTSQLTWSIDDTSVATVAGSGGTVTVTAVAEGHATLTVTFGDASASVALTVHHAALMGLSIDPDPVSVAAGLAQQLTATAMYANGTSDDVTATATWSTGDTDTATVDAAGNLAGVAHGTTTVTARFVDQTASAPVTVTDAVLEQIQVSPSPLTLADGTTGALHATGILSDASHADLTSQVTWSSGSETIATVSNGAATHGEVLAVDPGDATITATLGAVSGTGTVTVTDAVLVSIAVTPVDPSLPLGRTQQLTATGTLSDNSHQDLTAQATWSSNQASVSVTAGGLARAESLGAAVVTATVGTIHGSTVVAPTPALLVSIAVTPATPSVARGLTQQFTATGTFSDNSHADLTTQVTWASGDATIASVSNAAGSKGLGTAIALGSATISATSGTISGSTTMTVTDAVLVSIAVTPATPSIARGQTLALTATGTFSDGTHQDLTTQVTWDTVDHTIATVSNVSGAEGVATAVNLGTTDATATQGAISGSTSITVTDAVLLSIAVTPAGSSTAQGLTRQLTATGTLSDHTHPDLTAQVTWASGDDAVVTVSNAAGSHGLASTHNVGSTTVSATLGAISGSTGFDTVAATLVSIDVTPVGPSIARGTTLQLTATGHFTDGSHPDLTTQVTWGELDSNVVTVSNAAGFEGLATAANVGATTVSATLGTVAGTTGFTVTAADLVSIDITPADGSVPRGETQQLTATGLFTDHTHHDLTTQVTWGELDSDVVTVSNAPGSEGLASAANLGTTTVSATLGAIVGTTDFTTSDAVLLSIEVTPTSPNLAVDDSLQLTATGVLSDNTHTDLTTQVSWASSDTDVASVSNADGSQGLATGVGVGQATLSATLDGITGSTVMSVSNADLVSIEVTPADPSIASGSTQQLKATATYSDNNVLDVTTMVAWTSGDQNVVKVSSAAGSQGLATAINPGATTVTASLGAISGHTSFTTTDAVLVSIQVEPAHPSIAVGQVVPLTATGLFSDATHHDLTTAVTWSTSDVDTATVANAAGSEGLVTGVGIGTATITATLGTVSSTATVDVTAAQLVSIAVTPADSSVIKGNDLQLTAKGTYTDSQVFDITTQVTWTSSDTSIATVSNAAGLEGSAHGAGVGTATMTATLGAISGNTTLTVNAATLTSIVVTPVAPSIAKGQTQPFVATGHFSDGSQPDLTTQVTWASSDPTIATVSNASGQQGLATAVAVGTTTVSATLGAVSGSTTLTVTPATLVSIAVTATYPSLPRDWVQQYTATGTFSDGTTQDVTGSATTTWSSSDGTIAAVSNLAASRGFVTSSATNTGPVSITATVGTVSGSAPLAVSSCKVTVNELQTAGTGGASDEWVEIYNGCPFELDLIGTGVFYRPATTNSDTTLQNITVSTPFPAGSWKLYANSSPQYTGPAPDGTFGAGISAAGGGMAFRAPLLAVSSRAIIDSVGYGTATNAFVEGTAAAAPASAKSIGRHADGNDNNNNVADFTVTTTPTPRAANN